MIFLNSILEFGVMNILEYTINNNEHAYYISVSYINYDTHVKIWHHHIIISLVLPCKGTYSSNCLLFTLTVVCLYMAYLWVPPLYSGYGMQVDGRLLNSCELSNSELGLKTIFCYLYTSEHTIRPFTWSPGNLQWAWSIREKLVSSSQVSTVVWL